MISDNEVKECVWRHEHFLELKLRHPRVKHRKGCTRGKRMWRFFWKWPFVRTWISQAVCMCEIIAIDEMEATFDQVIEMMNGLGYDVRGPIQQRMVHDARTNRERCVSTYEFVEKR